MTRDPRPGAEPDVFTVVIPTRDRPDRLDRAVRSVLEQARATDEVVVVDDGSSPPVEKAGALADERVRVVRLPGHGPSAARNFGAAQGTGTWLTFLDDDDVALPGWLDTFRRALAGSGATTAFVGMEEHDPAGGVSVVLPEPSETYFAGNVISSFAGTFATRRSTFEAVGGYDPLLRQGENTELVIRLCAAGATTAVLEPRLRRNVDHGNSARRGPELRYQALVTRYERHGALLSNAGRSTELVVRGVAAARAGHLDAARADFARAVRLQPRSLGAWNRLLVSLVPPLATRMWVAPAGTLTGLRMRTLARRRAWRQKAKQRSSSDPKA